jgi:tripartite-type tricarboxylate transporter receptor subunit TctC
MRAPLRDIAAYVSDDARKGAIMPSMRILHPAALVCLAALALPAHPQKPSDAAYPARPVRLIVSQAAGGPTDIVARIYASRLSEMLGQQFVVDNRHSAGGSIAGEITARAAPDGYTLMVGANGTLAIGPHMIKLTFDARKDLTPVALIGNSPLGLLLNVQVPANSFSELLALAKSRPGTINFGSAGPGATSHLAGEYLKMLTGIDIVHVPYKGAGPALIGLASGQIEMMISGLSSGMPFVKRKQLKLLAVSSARRVALVPDVPAMAETVPGYDVGSWYAVLATAGTPRAVIDKLSQASIAAVTAPEVKSRLVALGIEVEPLTPPQLGTKLDSEYERWGKVVRAANMKPN